MATALVPARDIRRGDVVLLPAWTAADGTHIPAREAVVATAPEAVPSEETVDYYYRDERGNLGALSGDAEYTVRRGSPGAPAGTVEIPREVADRDGLDLSEIRPLRTCPYCQDGRGPEYGFEHGDRIHCDACNGSGYELAEPEPDSPPWIGPRLTGSIEERVALLLQYAAAAVLARRVTLPALRLAGMALCGAVAAGPRVVTTSGVEIKEVA